MTHHTSAPQANGGLAQHHFLLSLYHSLEEKEASQVDLDDESDVVVSVNPHCCTVSLTAGVRWGRATPDLQLHELHRRSRQLDAGLGPALVHRNPRRNPLPNDGDTGYPTTRQRRGYARTALVNASAAH